MEKEPMPPVLHSNHLLVQSLPRIGDDDGVACGEFAALSIDAPLRSGDLGIDNSAVTGLPIIDPNNSPAGTPVPGTHVERDWSILAELPMLVPNARVADIGRIVWFLKARSVEVQNGPKTSVADRGPIHHRRPLRCRRWDGVSGLHGAVARRRPRTVDQRPVRRGRLLRRQSLVVATD
jgi:hypothetical protein